MHPGTPPHTPASPCGGPSAGLLLTVLRVLRVLRVLQGLMHTRRGWSAPCATASATCWLLHATTLIHGAQQLQTFLEGSGRRPALVPTFRCVIDLASPRRGGNVHLCLAKPLPQARGTDSRLLKPDSHSKVGFEFVVFSAVTYFIQSCERRFEKKKK